MTSKIYSIEDLSQTCAQLRKNGKTIVSTNGCFDILHRGHVAYLQEAKKLGDFLVIGLNSDKSVKNIKDPSRPLNSELDRAFILSALECVDAVCIFNESTPVQFLQSIKSHIHVKGGDYKPENLPESSAIAQWGAKVVIIPFVKGYSTTDLIKRSQTVK